MSGICIQRHIVGNVFLNSTFTNVFHYCHFLHVERFYSVLNFCTSMVKLTNVFENCMYIMILVVSSRTATVSTQSKILFF